MNLYKETQDRFKQLDQFQIEGELPEELELYKVTEDSFNYKMPENIHGDFLTKEQMDWYENNPLGINYFVKGVPPEHIKDVHFPERIIKTL